MEREGPTRWSQAATFIKGRSGKQCRERWFNNLCPGVKKGNWSEEEDEMIFQLYQKYGSSWSKISKYIPGRTENAIKNRFYSTLRKIATDKKKIFMECGSNALKRELSDNFSAELNDDVRVTPSTKQKTPDANQQSANKFEMFLDRPSDIEAVNRGIGDQEVIESVEQNVQQIERVDNDRNNEREDTGLGSQGLGETLREPQKFICDLPNQASQQNASPKEDTQANINLPSIKLFKLLEGENGFEEVSMEFASCEMSTKDLKEDSELEKFLMKIDCGNLVKSLMNSQPDQKISPESLNFDCIKKRIDEFSKQNNIVLGATEYQTFSNIEVLLKSSLQSNLPHETRAAQQDVKNDKVKKSHRPCFEAVR